MILAVSTTKVGKGKKSSGDWMLRNKLLTDRKGVIKGKITGWPCLC